VQVTRIAAFNGLSVELNGILLQKQAIRPRIWALHSFASLPVSATIESYREAAQMAFVQTLKRLISYVGRLS